jgi:hypothetical protein
MMASRLVVLRERVVNAVQAAFNAWGDTLTTAVGERIEPFLEDGEVTFDLPLMRQVLQRMVAASFDDLVEADKGRVDELAGDVRPRIERDRWIAQVRQKLIEIRRIAEGLFGRRLAVEVVAIDGATAREPELLWRQAEHTLSRLRSPDLRIPQASTAAVHFDAAGLAAELDPLVTGLRGAIDVIKLDERLTAESRQAKQDAMDEHDLLIGACKGILSGFCMLARRPDLARRLRISLPRPRPGSSVSDSSPVEASDPSTDAEPTKGGETATA